MYTQHFRQINNQIIQIENLDSNDNYSFEEQTIHFFDPPKYIQPGDALVPYCIYNTTDRIDFTRNGISSLDEACYNILFYYPKITTWSICLGTNEHLAQCDTSIQVNSWNKIN